MLAPARFLLAPADPKRPKKRPGRACGPITPSSLTEALTAEFAAADERECRSLNDYMRLEDRLFEQLQKKVHQAVTEGGAVG